MKVKVRWTETSEYESVFDLDVEDAQVIEDSADVHELMDRQSAWDQVTQSGWLGKALVGINDRHIDLVELVRDEETSQSGVPDFLTPSAVDAAREEASDALTRYAETAREWNKPDDAHTTAQLNRLVADVIEDVFS